MDKRQVTYDANGGEFYDGEKSFIVEDLPENAILSKPVSPTRTGYDFIGWSTGKYISDCWDFDKDTVNKSFTLYAQWEEIFKRDETVQGYAEQLKHTNLVSSYATSLSSCKTETLGDSEVEQARKDGLLKDVEVNSVPAGKKVVYKKRSASYGLDDLSYYGANNNITYAGSMLKINETGTEIAPLIGLKRKPITLSIGLEGSTGVDYQRIQVDTVSQSTVGQSINQLVKGFTGETAQLPYMVALQLTEIKAKEEINAALGLSFNVGSFFNLSSEFDFSNKGEQTYAVLTLKQVYYTVNVDYYAEEGAFSLLDDNVTSVQLQNACGNSYFPTYVSSVSYGRIAAITLKTNKSFNALSASLNIRAGYWITDGEIDGEFDSMSQDSSIEYNWFIYGGSTSGNQEVLNGNSIKEMLLSLNQPYNPAKQVGVPISYQLSHLADNSSAKLGFTGEYYFAEIVDDMESKLQPGKTEKVSKTFEGEYRIEDNYGDYSVNGAGYIADNRFLSVDVSSLDLEFIEKSDCRVEIVIELSIKEKDDGYQEIYVYNAGVDKNKVQKGKDKPIASIELEHGVGKVNSTYQKYCLTAVISSADITSEKLWIAFDAWGNDEDTWFAKDITVTLTKTSKTAHTMYSEKV